MGIVKFGDVVERINIKVDQSNPQLNYMEHGRRIIIPIKYYVGGEHIEGSEFMVHKKALIQGSTIGYQFQFGFRKGDILFMTKNPHLRKASMVDFDGLCSIATFVIASKSNNLLQNYLLLEMQSDRFWQYCEDNKSGGVNYFINWGTLSNYEFDLPPIEKQKELADKLWAAYRLKEGYKRLLAAIDEMVKSQFIEMFGNPVNNSKSWPTKAIMEVAPEQPSKKQMPGKVWLLNLDMIESNTGKVIEKVYEISDNTLSVQPFDEDNVLFSKLRPYLNKVVVPDEYGLATTELVPLRPNQEVLNKVFLSYLLRSQQFVTFANKISGGTKMPRMPLAELRNFKCILPPMSEQLKFVSIAKQADKSKFGDFKSQFIEMFSKYPSETPWHKLLTIINGKAYPEEYNNIGTYPICGSAGIMYYGERKLCDANTIILGRKGNINHPIYMESDYWIVDTAFCLDVNKSILLPKYFYYWCCQYDFTKLNKQGVLPSLTRKDLEKIEMSVPPMAEQKKFVSIVEQADKSKSYVRIAFKNLESMLGYCIRQIS